ncbi:MAG: CHAT domain-containing protein [Gemmatimonadaceae bacterium]|nr:CHAT domain-containing protein [Gemmatimonadaceae bacterium]
MQRLRALTLAAIGLALPLQAQPGSPYDTLAPRVLWRLAGRAKAQDSMPSRMAEWRTWAAARPEAAAPRLGLAMLSRFDSRYADAMAWLDSAARVAREPLWRAAIARERVGAMLVRGDFRDVERLMAVALADSAGMPREEWAETRFVQLALERRVHQRTTLAGIEAVAALATSQDSVLQARLSCLRVVADPERRMAHASASFALADAVGLPALRANCELALGSQLMGQGLVNQAVTWLERAQATARAAHDDPTLAAALQWHGYALRTVGMIRSSRAQLTAAIRVAQRIDDRNIEAWALLSVAGVARQTGDAAAATAALRRALRLFEASGDRVGYEEGLLEQAQAMLLVGDLQNAERVAQHSALVSDSLGLPSMRIRSTYALADIAVRTNRTDVARDLLDRIEPVVRERGAAWMTQLTEYRGLLALRNGRSDEAIRLLAGVRDTYSRASQPLFRHNVDGALALASLLAGDSVSAARTLVEANRELDDMRDTLAEAGLRKVLMPPDMWGGTSGNVDRVLAAFVQSPRWLPTVFAVAERSRARALLNGTLGSETTRDTAVLREARRRVRASATVLADVQRALKPHTALLVYAGGSDIARTSLMVITSTQARGVTLAPLDSLDRDIVRWLALLESGETGAGAGRRVATAVLGDALRSLPAGIRHLVVVPQGALYRVPFQALPMTARGVLGDRMVVTIAPSVSLALAYAAAPRAVDARVLALGAGDTEVASETPQSMELSVERSERGNPLAPLLAAADEARAAAAWGRGSLALTGGDASESALKRAARSSYTVLHTAAHALTSDQALGANWLILRPDSLEDGYVSGGELAELSSGASMVVLSGCRTTGDFGSRGDAIDGLVAPLLARGVRTVVASHWAVSDRWTRVLMERFYRNLAEGRPAADAMNAAQTSLRRAGVPARFWAAFSVIGDGALTFTR